MFFFGWRLRFTDCTKHTHLDNSTAFVFFGLGEEYFQGLLDEEQDHASSDKDFEDQTRDTPPMTRQLDHPSGAAVDAGRCFSPLLSP